MVGTAVSILTLIGGIIGFAVYGWKLNKLALRQAERDAKTAISADVIVELCKATGNNRLLVKNVGQVAADNVEVVINPDVRCMPNQFLFPMRLESGQTVAISISCSIGGPMRTTVSVKWKDEAHTEGAYKTFDTPLFS